MKQIVAAIDFSDATDRVIASAVEYQRAFNCKLLILHTEPPVSYSITGEFPTLYSADTLSYELDLNEILLHRKERDQELMSEIWEKLINENVHADTLLLEGVTVENLVRQAYNYHADLIVIGSHEHGKFYHFLFGSVRESLMKLSPCPILIIPPHENEKWRKYRKIDEKVSLPT